MSLYSVGDPTSDRCQRSGFAHMRKMTTTEFTSMQTELYNPAIKYDCMICFLKLKLWPFYAVPVIDVSHVIL